MADQQPDVALDGDPQSVANENAAPITLSQFQGVLNEFEQRISPHLDHIAVQVYNASLSDTSPLLYPPGVYRDFMPRTKANLLRLTARQCSRTAAGLGLPALPQGTLIADRRWQIQYFLGAV